jgi:hypothetical protein
MKSSVLIPATAVAIVFSAHVALAKGAPVVRVEGKPIEYSDVAQGFAHFRSDQRAARLHAIDRLRHHD